MNQVRSDRTKQPEDIPDGEQLLTRVGAPSAHVEIVVGETMGGYLADTSTRRPSHVHIITPFPAGQRDWKPVRKKIIAVIGQEQHSFTTVF